MTPNVHFDPNAVTNHMEEKETVRPIFAIAATENKHLDQFYITAAFIHENNPPNFPVYVRQLPRFGGTFDHRHKTGKMLLTLYGYPNASKVYNIGLHETFTANYFTHSTFNTCLYLRHIEHGFVKAVVCMD